MKILTLILYLCVFFSASLAAQSTSCISTTSLMVNIQICDAVSEIVGLNDLTIAPNPSQGQFDLSFEMETNTILNIRLLDGLKRTLYQEDGEFNGLVHKTIQVNDLASGIYLLILQHEAGIVTRKVVVQ